MPAARIIKRYANRKLYDTRSSRYVTLQKVAELVRDGEDVRIVDNRTKEDLTHVTLAQIIYEEQKKAPATEGPAARSLRSFVQQGSARILTSLRDGPVGRFVPRAEEELPEEEAHAEGDVRRFPKELFDELARVTDGRMRGLVGAALSHVQQLHAEVRRLQGRIEELEDGLRRAGNRLSRRGGRQEGASSVPSDRKSS